MKTRTRYVTGVPRLDAWLQQHHATTVWQFTAATERDLITHVITGYEVKGKLFVVKRTIELPDTVISWDIFSPVICHEAWTAPADALDAAERILKAERK